MVFKPSLPTTCTWFHCFSFFFFPARKFVGFQFQCREWLDLKRPEMGRSAMFPDIPVTSRTYCPARILNFWPGCTSSLPYRHFPGRATLNCSLLCLLDTQMAVLGLAPGHTLCCTYMSRQYRSSHPHRLHRIPWSTSDGTPQPGRRPCTCTPAATLYFVREY